MAAFRQPIGKLSRRLGVGITPKGGRILQRRPNPPGQHGGSRTRKLSDYAIQLREKQKARAFYGLHEKQFRRLFDQALHAAGATDEVLLSLLERRLDNVVYRQGLAVTRAQARQLVSHGHFTVNGVKTNIPSYTVRPGEVIAVRARSRTSPYFQELLASRALVHAVPPDWFEQVGPDRFTWRISALPRREHAEPAIDASIIVEFYSR